MLPQACTFGYFSSQMVELFGNVVEPLGGRNSLEEVGHWGEGHLFYTLAPFPVYALLTEHRHR